MTKTLTAMIIAALLAGTAAAFQFDQVQRRLADSTSLRTTVTDGALLQLRLNSVSGTRTLKPAGVVYLIR